MTKKIKAITAKDNIYWEGSDGREEDFICKKSVTYPIYDHCAGKVYFKNHYNGEHRWNINELEEDFIIHSEDDKYFLVNKEYNNYVFHFNEENGLVTWKDDEGFLHKVVYDQEDYNVNVKSGAWIPCDEKGNVLKKEKPVYKISYTLEELNGKELMCHKDVYLDDSPHKVDRCFIKGKTYGVKRLQTFDLGLEVSGT